MKPSLQKLQKILELEIERKYDNRAVFGGLERYVDRWEAEAHAEELPEELVRVVIERLRDYPRLTEKSRAEALEGLLRRIRRSSGQPDSEPSRPRPAAPVAERVKPSQEEEPPATPVAARTAPRSKAWVASPGDGEPAALDAAITVLPGVGPKNAQNLASLGLRTLRDMLYYYPRRYNDYSQLKPINRLKYGEVVTVIGAVQRVGTYPARSGKLTVIEALISDGTGVLRVNWYNQVHIARRLHPGMALALSGKIDQYLGRLVMNNPEWERLEQEQLSTNRIAPVYAINAQITQTFLRKQMNTVVTYWAPRVQDPLPEALRQQAELMPLSTALLQVHFPDTLDDLKAAQERLAFDEIFLLQLGVLRQKRAWKERTARVFSVEPAWLETQTARLPYELTGAQQRALEDIQKDLASGQPMNRLIQGDVGSGKTVVAALAMAMVAKHGAQSAIMAPTSILAEQHYHNLLRLLAGEDEAAPLVEAQIRLLLGATPEEEKREIRAGLESGAIKLVVGTHALIEDPITFADLQMVVIDEQHRFGVDQRAALRTKGDNPHLLVMTATPIPRSLALTVYGDLDLTVIDEMPPGRQPVNTYVLAPRERERAYGLIRSQVKQGRQAFIIYPLVEESDKSESGAAVEEQERLQREIFPELRIGLLHGRLRAEEKEAVMSAFSAGQYHILVSTSVVEVGVDIPNATVMLIEGANRFGLAQLHQFRGRVGRGADQSYCLLIPESADQVENERLQVMIETNDGFLLAERDLQQRGPGQFLGTRQAGYAELRISSLTNIHLIDKARRFALALFEQDPDLNFPEHHLLASALQRAWGEVHGDIS